MNRHLVGLAVLFLAVAGCSKPHEQARPPNRLAETGLYEDFDRRLIAPDVLPYTPQYALWSDGARKQRWIRLPAGTAIDATGATWRFPVGTRLWKEFAFERRVETRFMQLDSDGLWVYATYVWSADGSDATLAPVCGVRAAWRNSSHSYDVPAHADCRVCHEGGAGPVLGFRALQLSVDRDPLALHAESPSPGSLDLAELQRRGLVRGVLDLAPRIAARSPRERAALGYLHANCGSCHNQRGSLADLGLVLEWCSEHEVAGAIATGCEQKSRFCPPGHDPRGSVRLRPGDPDGSVLMFRATTRNPLSQMPPLGTKLVDPAAAQLLAEWIREDLPQTATETAK